MIPCAHFGALCFGTEIDKRVLQGYGVGRLNKKSPFYKGFFLKIKVKFNIFDRRERFEDRHLCEFQTI